MILWNTVPRVWIETMRKDVMAAGSCARRWANTLLPSASGWTTRRQAGHPGVLCGLLLLLFAAAAFGPMPATADGDVDGDVRAGLGGAPGAPSAAAAREPALPGARPSSVRATSGNAATPAVPGAATLPAGAARPAGGPPSVLIILTDDQRADSLWAMQHVSAQLVARGTRFSRAYSPTPWCCPARTSLLAGGFHAHNTQVHTNGSTGNFNDADTIATRLQAAGYQTAMIGKYLVQYPGGAPYVPPGWSYFNATASPQAGMDWFDFEVAIGSSTPDESGWGEIVSVQQYVTDYQRDRALEFLDQQVPGQPFLLYFSTHAAHGPYTPAPEDDHVFDDFVYDSPSFLEEDLSDKPQWVQDNATQTFNMSRPRQELESLLAVDRAVLAFVQKLEERGLLDDTYIIFTSDQGNMWGEHGLVFKGKPYEESTRVPLVVRGPGVVENAVRDELVANTLDVGRTVTALIGAVTASDGLDLRPLLRGETVPWREMLLHQTFAEPTFTSLRVSRADGEWVYTEWGGGGIELYDLATDPFQLESIHDLPAQQGRIQEFAAALGDLRGLGLKVDALPTGWVGEPYDFTLEAWGGALPYTWGKWNLKLPPELDLDPQTGRITGVPARVECVKPSFFVTAPSLATHALYEELNRRAYDFCVAQRAPDSDGDGYADTADNCVLVPNADQRDTDGDGFGSACDGDLNDDCWVDFVDLAVFKSVFLTADPDADLDGSGLVDFQDFILMRPQFYRAPGPSGVANLCDTP